MRKVREAVCYGIALTGIEALIGSFAAYGQGWIPGMKCLGIAGMAAVAVVIGIAEAEND
jgi:fatty acid desaturase